MDQPPDRDARGRFQPGQSGNPKGKPPGTVHFATALRRMLRDGEDDAAARIVIERATGGDPVTARFLLDRLEPRPRTRPLPLDLSEEADVGASVEAVFAGFASGAISPDEALTAARFLDRLSAARGGDAARAATDLAALRDELAQLRAELGAVRAELAAVRRDAAPAAPQAGAPEPPADLNSTCISRPDDPPLPVAPPASVPPAERQYALPEPAAPLHSTCISRPDAAPPTRSRTAYWTGRRRQRQRAQNAGMGG